MDSSGEIAQAETNALMSFDQMLPVQGAAVAHETHHACWYAAYTYARHEKVIARQLSERSITHFLPLYTSVRRWKDRRKQLDLPLFPGYIFVRVSDVEQLRVLQLPSVVRFVSFNGVPATLPDNDIDALRNGVAHNLLMKAHPYLRIGRKVRVISGPLAGAEGILLRRKDNLRIVISIEALMRAVAVEIDAADVEVIA